MQRDVKEGPQQPPKGVGEGGGAPRGAPRGSEPSRAAREAGVEGTGGAGPSVPRAPASERRRAALNAALGDYLERRGSPLAIPMQLRHQGRPLRVSAGELEAAHLTSSTRIAVFVHGLGQTEACWVYRRDPSMTYGTQLQEELGLTPFYVRYNTGRRISHNGRALAALLEQLALALPSIDDITLVGHSMGGLVIRSACHYAMALGHGWVALTRRCVYLGSPHLGSPLEKAGTLVSSVLGSLDNPVVRLIHDATDLRGVGIKDLGEGCLLDEDWSGPGATSIPSRRPTAVPLASGMRHYFIAGTLSRDAGGVAAFLMGDSVVRLSSATGPARAGGVTGAEWVIVPGVPHMHLSRSPEVHARLRAWLAAALEPSGMPLHASARREVAPPSDAAGRRAAAREPLPDDAAVRADAPQGEAYATLLGDAIERGATAIQQVQEELTARPYDLLELVPPLALPARVVRSLHLGGARRTYHLIRWANRATTTALGAALGWAGRRSSATGAHR